jgi:hypothetical protein
MFLKECFPYPSSNAPLYQEVHVGIGFKRKKKLPLNLYLQGSSLTVSKVTDSSFAK